MPERQIISHYIHNIHTIPVHPLMRALGSLHKGTLEVTLPEGETVLYDGEEAGASAHICLHDRKAFDQIAARGAIGLGEGYVEKLWDTDDLKGLLRILADNRDIFQSEVNGASVYRKIYTLKNRLRANTRRGSRKNIHAHYDLGNDFYRLWLDETMTYSSALFHGDTGMALADAQRAKYHRILDMLDPAPSAHILEIGCGWGGFMEEAAKRGHRVMGVTISREQAAFAKNRLKEGGFGKLAAVRLEDYRQVSGQYDHIVSIGMMEHVGERFWGEYMARVHDNLKPGGTAMIQCIIVQDEFFNEYRASSDFIREHIFPGGMLPCPARFKEEAVRAGLDARDIFGFGGDYAITLERWLDNFDTSIDQVKALGYDERFIRKWRFYLASCAAMFRAGKIGVMQVNLAKPGGQYAV